MSGVRKLLISLSVLPLVLNVPALAWDDEGHMAVAYVAYQHLNTPTKARVAELLRLNPDYQTWKAAVPSGTAAAKRKMLIFMMGNMAGRHQEQTRVHRRRNRGRQSPRWSHLLAKYRLF